MRRSRATLEDVAALPNLAWALWRAARSAGRRAEVECLAQNLEGELSALRAEILACSVSVGSFHRFRIRDPKPRVIHAPCFRERVLHHALMRVVGPVLERAMVPDSFACREGKGAHAAVRRAQHHSRRFPWFVKADVRAYFDSVDHARLKTMLGRRFKDSGLLTLCERVIDAYEVAPGKGLPIGALYSQHFANYYLTALDRFLLDRQAGQTGQERLEPQERQGAKGLVRYMDDSVWWCVDRGAARATLQTARAFAKDELLLELKATAQIGQSRHGVTLCGFRVLPGTLRLSRRRRVRYARARRHWETLHRLGAIDALGLQGGYAAALAVTAHADAAGYRRAELLRAPAPDC